MPFSKMILSIIVTGTLAVLSGPIAEADTITVAWDGSGDYLTIQDGIDASADGDEVVLSPGTYRGVGNTNVDFHGKAITVRSASSADAAIIDCQELGRGFYFHSGEGSASVLQGLIITNGSAVRGGAIDCQKDSSPTIANCTITGNSAKRGGGLYCAHGSSPAVTNCILWGNTATEGSQVALDDASQISVSYSDVQGGQYGVTLGDRCTLNWGEGNIDQDPQFALPGDYRLIASSPCIDGGANPLPVGDVVGLGVSNSDEATVPAVDIGAHEFDAQSPLIALSPTTLEFSVSEGDRSASTQKLLLRHCGVGEPHWQIGQTPDWLIVDQPTAVSESDIQMVMVRVNAEGLTHGQYSCALVVSDPNVAGSARTSVVTLNVSTTLHVPLDYPTIGAATDAAVDGDIILVADGTYAGNSDLGFSRSLTVRSEHGAEHCIIDCGGAEHCFGIAGDAVIEGFTIKNASSHAFECVMCHVTIANCIICGNAGCGINLEPFCRAEVYNCMISDNAAGGIFCRLTFDLTVTHCTITRNSALTCGGLYCWEDSSATITNSILWDNSATNGPQITVSGPDLCYFGDVTLSYNDIQGGQDAIYIGLGGQSCVGSSVVHWGDGNIDEDPLFVNSASGDCHLTSGSPCIDAGDNDASDFMSDLDGNPRIVHAIVDIGAYEFQPFAPILDILPNEDPNPFSANANNGHGKAKVPMAIFATRDLAAEDIDPDSIRIAGTLGPVKTSTDADVNGDGLVDLLVHFSKAALIDALNLDTYKVGAIVDLTVTADRVGDHWPIEATDGIVIVGRRKKGCFGR